MFKKELTFAIAKILDECFAKERNTNEVLSNNPEDKDANPLYKVLKENQMHFIMDPKYAVSSNDAIHSLSSSIINSAQNGVVAEVDKKFIFDYAMLLYEQHGRVCLIDYEAESDTRDDGIHRWVNANKLNFVPKINDTFLVPTGADYMYYVEENSTTHVITNPGQTRTLDTFIPKHMVSFMNVTNTYCILKEGFTIDNVLDV